MPVDRGFVVEGGSRQAKAKKVDTGNTQMHPD